MRARAPESLDTQCQQRLAASLSIILADGLLLIPLLSFCSTAFLNFSQRNWRCFTFLDYD